MTESRSVLIVEDNPVLAESMAFALSTFGWTVIGPAATNAEAEAFIAKGALSIAVLDVDLGVETSIPSAEALRSLGLPFIFLTGLTSNVDVPEAFRNETWLMKPVLPEALIEALESAVMTSAERS